MNITCRVSNFSIASHTSATSQPETLPGKRNNVPTYERNKTIFGWSKCFLANRDNYFSYEQALSERSLEKFNLLLDYHAMSCRMYHIFQLTKGKKHKKLFGQLSMQTVAYYLKLLFN